ncbi:MAG TPA: hypothetical protein VNC39_07470 [Acidocella sp.]|jgi:hypothetical protein|nr:hypothetical protein [Acidocella sp.]
MTARPVIRLFVVPAGWSLSLTIDQMQLFPAPSLPSFCAIAGAALRIGSKPLHVTAFAEAAPFLVMHLPSIADG